MSEILEQNRRRARTHAPLGDLAERAAPHEGAVEVVGVDAGGFEVGEDEAAVGDRRRRGVGVLSVTVVVHQPVVGRALPHDAAGARIERDDLQRVAILHADAVWMEISRPQVVAEVIGSRVSGHALAFDGRGQEDAIVPDDRRRMTAAGDRRLPRDVLVWRPFVGIAGGVRHAAAGRAAPLRPVVAGRADPRGRECEDTEGNERDADETHGTA